MVAMDFVRISLLLLTGLCLSSAIHRRGGSLQPAIPLVSDDSSLVTTGEQVEAQVGMATEMKLEDYKIAYICEDTTKKIVCPAKKRVSVLESSWGRTSTRICPNVKNYNTFCFFDTTKLVDKWCLEQGSTCVLEAKSKSGFTLKDNCVGTAKYLKVKYICIDGHKGRDVIMLSGKPTFQSSSGYASPDRAVDGSTSGLFHADKSCSHTGFDQPAWWYVDMEHFYSVEHVQIYNRVDGNKNYLVGVRVAVLPLRPTPKPDERYWCAEADVNPDVQMTGFPCGNRVGRFVHVFHVKQAYLVLCEVNVVGSSQGNLLLNTGSPRILTNGVTDAMPYFNAGEGVRFISFDLGGLVALSHVIVYRPWDQEMYFKDEIFQFSMNGKYWVTAWNSDRRGLLGEGVGSNGDAKEQISGTAFYIAGQLARYFRVWSNGNNKDDNNYVVEVEAYPLIDRSRNVAVNKASISKEPSSVPVDGQIVGAIVEGQAERWVASEPLKNSYYTVDLGRNYQVSLVQIYPSKARPYMKQTLKTYDMRTLSNRMQALLFGDWQEAMAEIRKAPALCNEEVDQFTKRNGDCETGKKLSSYIFYEMEIEFFTPCATPLKFEVDPRSPNTEGWIIKDGQEHLKISGKMSTDDFMATPGPHKLLFLFYAPQDQNAPVAKIQVHGQGDARTLTVQGSQRAMGRYCAKGAVEKGAIAGFLTITAAKYDVPRSGTYETLTKQFDDDAATGPVCQTEMPMFRLHDFSPAKDFCTGKKVTSVGKGPTARSYAVKVQYKWNQACTAAIAFAFKTDWTSGGMISIDGKAVYVTNTVKSYRKLAATTFFPGEHNIELLYWMKCSEGGKGNDCEGRVASYFSIHGRPWNAFPAAGTDGRVFKDEMKTTCRSVVWPLVTEIATFKAEERRMYAGTSYPDVIQSFMSDLPMTKTDVSNKNLLADNGRGELGPPSYQKIWGLTDRQLQPEQPGRNTNFGSWFRVNWIQPCQFYLEFKMMVDWGKGGMVALDGAITKEWVEDVRRWIETGEMLIKRGAHTMDFLGFEGCCDGTIYFGFKVKKSKDDQWSKVIQMNPGAFQTEVLKQCENAEMDVSPPIDNGLKVLVSQVEVPKDTNNRVDLTKVPGDWICSDVVAEPAKQDSLPVVCKGKIGRYVTVYQTAESDWGLWELEVYPIREVDVSSHKAVVPKKVVGGRPFLRLQDYLNMGEYLSSKNGLFFMTVQKDCNVLVAEGSSPDTRTNNEIIYQSNKHVESSACYLLLDSDGAMNVYNGQYPSKRQLIYTIRGGSGSPLPDGRLTLRNTRDLVLTDQDGKQLWTSGTKKSNGQLSDEDREVDGTLEILDGIEPYNLGNGMRSYYLDLGTMFLVERINIVHYWKEGEPLRKYKGVLVQVSRDQKWWMDAYNNDYNRLLGFLDRGTEKEYFEQKEGMEIIVGGYAGRYIRSYSFGNNIDNFNHLQRLRVFVRPIDWIPIMKMGKSNDFFYASPHWTQETTYNDGVNVKYSAFNTLPFRAMIGCVGCATCNCIVQHFDEVQPSARKLFSQEYTYTRIRQMEWENAFDIPRGKIRPCVANKPGFNTIHGPNKARWGYFNNIPSQECDKTDSDGAIGFGIEDQTGQAMNAGYTNFVVSNVNNAHQENYVEAYLYVIPDVAIQYLGEVDKGRIPKRIKTIVDSSAKVFSDKGELNGEKAAALELSNEFAREMPGLAEQEATTVAKEESTKVLASKEEVDKVVATGLKEGQSSADEAEKILMGEITEKVPPTAYKTAETMPYAIEGELRNIAPETGTKVGTVSGNREGEKQGLVHSNVDGLPKTKTVSKTTAKKIATEVGEKAARKHAFLIANRDVAAARAKLFRFDIKSDIQAYKGDTPLGAPYFEKDGVVATCMDGDGGKIAFGDLKSGEFSLQFDVLAKVDFVKVRILSTGKDSVWAMQWSDDKKTWNTVGQNSKPFIADWNEFVWTSGGAHQYWRLQNVLWSPAGGELKNFRWFKSQDGAPPLTPEEMVEEARMAGKAIGVFISDRESNIYADQLGAVKGNEYAEIMAEKTSAVVAKEAVIAAAKKAGFDAGYLEGTDTGRAQGTVAGTAAGKLAGTAAATISGTESGKIAGAISGEDYGRRAGEIAGTDAGTKAGIEAGTEEGRRVGLINAPPTAKKVAHETALDSAQRGGVDGGVAGATEYMEAMKPAILATQTLQDKKLVALQDELNLYRKNVDNLYEKTTTDFNELTVETPVHGTNLTRRFAASETRLRQLETGDAPAPVFRAALSGAGTYRQIPESRRGADIEFFSKNFTMLVGFNFGSYMVNETEQCAVTGGGDGGVYFGVNQRQLVFGKGGSSTNPKTGVDIKDHGAYVVLISWTGNGFRLYVLDKVIEDRGYFDMAGQTFDNDEDFILGAYDVGGKRLWNGAIHEVALFAGVLDEFQRKAVMTRSSMKSHIKHLNEEVDAVWAKELAYKKELAETQVTINEFRAEIKRREEEDKRQDARIAVVKAYLDKYQLQPQWVEDLETDIRKKEEKQFFLEEDIYELQNSKFGAELAKSINKDTLDRLEALARTLKIWEEAFSQTEESAAVRDITLRATLRDVGKTYIRVDRSQVDTVNQHAALEQKTASNLKEIDGREKVMDKEIAKDNEAINVEFDPIVKLARKTEGATEKLEKQTAGLVAQYHAFLQGKSEGDVDLEAEAQTLRHHIHALRRQVTSVTAKLEKSTASTVDHEKRLKKVAEILDGHLKKQDEHSKKANEIDQKMASLEKYQESVVWPSLNNLDHTVHQTGEANEKPDARSTEEAGKKLGADIIAAALKGRAKKFNFSKKVEKKIKKKRASAPPCIKETGENCESNTLPQERQMQDAPEWLLKQLGAEVQEKQSNEGKEKPLPSSHESTAEVEYATPGSTAEIQY